MRHEETMMWFGIGPMSSLPQTIAWSMWVLIALLGIAVIVFSHRRTLVALTPSRRGILTTLRILFWLTLLIFLAAPTRVDRTRAENRPKKALAVAVDRSPSMGMPAQGNKTRIEEAAARWRPLEKEAKNIFPEINYFRFSKDVSPASNLDAAISGEDGPPETYLYQSLAEVIEKAPPGGWGAIVCLTDGFDTQSPGNEMDFVNKSISANSPVYFLPARNQSAIKGSLGVREIDIPRNVVKKTSFTWRSLIQSFSNRSRGVTVTLRKNGIVIAQEKLALGPGSHTLNWDTEVKADETGRIPFEMTLEGDDGAKSSIRTTVLVSDNQDLKIFYYQGAMDWGFRFIAGILRKDPKFQMTSAFHLAKGRDSITSNMAGSQPSFAEDTMEQLDVVILDGVSSAQLTETEESQLEGFVRNGGALLFLTPDDNGGFADTPLEKILPVSFYSTPQGKQSYGDFKLEPMRLTGEFLSKSGATSPGFANYQLFKDRKPGAEVQGIHGRDKNPDTGKPAILMATQQYGSGQVCVLGTDSLWRWKLSQSAQSKDVEIFWQNLLNWLVRGRRNAPQFDHPPTASFVGKTLTIRVQAEKKDSVLVLSAQGPDQQTKPCALKPTGADGSWEAEWTPDQAGDWILIAQDEKGLRNEHLLSVEKQSSAGEFNSLPPDEEKMRKLAEMTGGELIGNAIPPQWKESKPQENEASATEVKKPLWHHGWLLALCLLCYASELLTRRRWRML